MAISVLTGSVTGQPQRISTAYAIFDSTFNGTGFRNDGLIPSESMAIQADGKIVVVGSRQPAVGPGFSVIRLNPDGSLDASFGGDGEILTPIITGIYDTASSVAIQSDGKIVVGGIAYSEDHSLFYFALVRYNSDGSLDTTFDGDGKVTTLVSSTGGAGLVELAIQPDGKMVLTGGKNGDLATLRYNPDGSLDTTWDGDGIAITPILSNFSEFPSSIAVQPDGKVIVAGWIFIIPFSPDFALVRYNSDGTLDTTFDGDGKVITDLFSGADFAYSIAIQPDGKILVAGMASNNAVVVRYNIGGSLDAAFGSNGKVSIALPMFRTRSWLFSIKVLPNGRILAVGGADIWNGGRRPVLVLLNSDGLLDKSFDRDGIATPATFFSGSFRDVRIDDQGRIVTTGDSHTAARIKVGPTVDATASPFDFDGDGRADLSVWRPSNSTWYFQSAQGFSRQQFGQVGDKPVPADYDRDGKDDLAVFRPSDNTWHIIESGTSTTRIGFWGQTGDVPLPADITGDGRAELVTYNPASRNWGVKRLYESGDVREPFGAVGDKPVRGDFDGDGQDDVAVYRPSDHRWIIEKPFLREIVLTTWGADGDIPVPADYDADGRTDIAVWRPSTGRWYIIGSSVGWMSRTWGVPNDIPVPADYDGDGRADLAIFRPLTGTWYIIFSATGSFYVRQFGQDGDLPLASAFVQ